MAPFVFLSHSGADAESARELKRRLLASDEAKASGLKVWFDKDDLRPGEQWQSQIEQAINDATAFVVYVGSLGVINWVDIEVRTALSRAATEKDFLFIPVLAPRVEAGALPPFAKLYQGVADPLGAGDGLERLLKAVLKADWDTSIKLVDDPFVGLRSMREDEADRFFGRDAEVAELAEKVRTHRIVAVVADSGTGKSSLAAAGFAPKFRGGALAEASRAEPDERVWHVVTMRPGANPEEGLKTGVSEAAERLGRSGDERASLRRRIALGDASETAFALQCDLPPTKTSTLLIVDQFEELLTQTPPALAAPFARLLLALADSDKDIRILLTVRADYFNLVSAVLDAGGQATRGADGRTLHERLTANGGEAILRLKRISDKGLADAIVKPLRRAGDTDEAAQDAIVSAVRRDISDQPSDLPLMQVALRAAWRQHRATGIGLLEAYQAVGGVLGALANEAEAARGRLPEEDQARLESAFVRLVQLGDTGGATRRTAALSEFDGPRQALLRRLAEDTFGRLVVVGETNAEIAHEALITQWPWLQRTLKADARDVRILVRFMDKAREWRSAPDGERVGYLSTGAERLLFSDLAKRRPDWLSPDEAQFVAASDKAHDDEQRARSRRALVLAAVAALVFLALGASALYAQYERARAVQAAETADRNAGEAIAQKNAAIEAAANAQRQKQIALEQRDEAMTTQSRFLAGSAMSAVSAGDPVRALDLAIEALPNPARSDRPYVPQAEYALRLADRVFRNSQLMVVSRLRGLGKSDLAAISPDPGQVAIADGATVRIVNAQDGSTVQVLPMHDGHVWSLHYLNDGSSLVVASDQLLRVWSVKNNASLLDLRPDPSKQICGWAYSGGTDIGTAVSLLSHVPPAPSESTPFVNVASWTDGAFAFSKAPDCNAGQLPIPDQMFRSTKMLTVSTDPPTGTIQMAAIGNQDGKLMFLSNTAGGGPGFDGPGKANSEEFETVMLTPSRFQALASTADGTVVLWNIQSRNKAAVFDEKEKDAIVDVIDVTPQGDQTLFHYSNGVVKIVKRNLSDEFVKTEAVQMEGMLESQSTNCGVKADDGVISVGERKLTIEDGSITLSSTESNEKAAQLLTKEKDEDVASVAYSADGSRIFVLTRPAGDGHSDSTFSLRAYSADTGDQLGQKRLDNTSNPDCLIVSPDGAHVIAAKGNGLSVIDINDGLEHPIYKYSEDIKIRWRNFSFNPSGRRFMAYDSNNNLGVFGVDGVMVDYQQLPATLSDPVAMIYDATGARILKDRNVAYRWSTPENVSDLDAAAREEVSQCLTTEERKEFFLDSDPPDWCVEKNKTPYDTRLWQDWLVHKRQGERSAPPTAPN
jgi:WD40 repeat protein